MADQHPSHLDPIAAIAFVQRVAKLYLDREIIDGSDHQHTQTNDDDAEALESLITMARALTGFENRPTGEHKDCRCVDCVGEDTRERGDDDGSTYADPRNPDDD
jgi:hypothetical protein